MKRKKILLCITVVLLAILSVLTGVIVSIIMNDSKQEKEEDFQAFYAEFSEDEVSFDENTLYVESRLLITATEEAKYRQIEKLVKKTGGTIIGYISISNDYQVGFDNASYEQLLEKIEQLQKSELIVDVGLEILTKTESTTTKYKTDPWQASGSDDKSGKKWKGIDGANWGVESILMPQVWGNKSYEFSDVKVGVIDSYFDTACTELSGKIEKVYGQNNLDVAELYRKDKVGYKNEAGDWVSVTEQNHIIGHGTHVSGIIAANNNSVGITGISQNAILYGYSSYSEHISHDNSTYSEKYAEQLSSSMQLKYEIACLLNDNVKMINISLGFDPERIYALYQGMAGRDDRQASTIDGYNRDIKSMEEFLRRCLKKYDFLIINSAGNSSNNNNKYVKTDITSKHPYGYRMVWYDENNDKIDETPESERLSSEEVDAKYVFYFAAIKDENVRNHIIIVGSYDYDMKLKAYSKSSFSCSGDAVDIYAPGGYLKKNNTFTNIGILSSYPDNEIVYSKGTSMAAPMVTGVAALVWGIDPNFSAKQVRDFIVDASGQFDSGRRLNALLAVEFANIAKGNHAEKSNYSAILMVHISTDDLESDDTSDSENVDEGLEYEFHIFDELGEEIEFVKEGDDLYSILEPGTYTVSSVLPGYEDYNETITLNVNETKYLEINHKKPFSCDDLFGEYIRDSDNVRLIIEPAGNDFIGFYTIYDDPIWGVQRWLVSDCYRQGDIIKGTTSARNFNPADVTIEKVGDELYITTGNSTYHYYRIDENTATSTEFTGLLKGIAIGDRITFGINPYDDQPIEWYIIDIEDDKALLFPVNNLYEWAYSFEHNSNNSLNWQYCYLRESLNRDFFPQAFNEEEWTHVLATDVSTLDYNGEYITTRDIMYLLSPEEFSTYIEGKEYAVGGNPWWLRSPYSSSGECYFVNYITDPNTPIISDYTLPAADKLGVRPVIWVSDQAGEYPHFVLGIYSN